MTSNIGSDHLREGVSRDGQIERDAREAVMAEVRRHFRADFLDRLDDIVLFKPLTRAETERIVELMLDDLRARLAARRIAIDLSPDAGRYLADNGYDPVDGARPLRRLIARELEPRIARALLAGTVRDGATARRSTSTSTVAS